MKKKANQKNIVYCFLFSAHSESNNAAIYSIDCVHSLPSSVICMDFSNFTNTQYTLTHRHTRIHTQSEKQKKIIDIYCLETHDTRVQYRTLTIIIIIIRYKMACLSVVEIVINWFFIRVFFFLFLFLVCGAFFPVRCIENVFCFFFSFFFSILLYPVS